MSGRAQEAGARGRPAVGRMEFEPWPPGLLAGGDIQPYTRMERATGLKPATSSHHR